MPTPTDEMPAPIARMRAYTILLRPSSSFIVFATSTIDSFKAIGWQNIATIMIATESIKSHTRKRAQPGKIFPKATKDSFQFTDIKTLFVQSKASRFES